MCSGYQDSTSHSLSSLVSWKKKYENIDFTYFVYLALYQNHKFWYQLVSVDPGVDSKALTII